MAAFGLFLTIALALLGWHWLRQQSAPQRGAALIKLSLGLAVLLLAYLAVTGRMHVAGLLLAAVYPFVRRYLPALLQQMKSSGGSGNQSTVTSEVLEMTLDHDTGAMQGRILCGPLQGRALGSLEEDEFIQLLQYCRQKDADSARLLETYLDRRFGESWRDDDPGEADADEGPAGSAENRQADRGELSRDEAFEILGLEPGASREEITQAHRRLMQRMHPDRGGSAYLAARINAARKLLLD